MTTPFEYPSAGHVRKHGPRGYADYLLFRPWLRDEFTFRCVYCLRRERWGLVRAAFHIDHFLPVVLNREGALDYDNLVYSCSSCNTGKAGRLIPNPLNSLIRSAIQVNPDGSIEASSDDARQIILLLDLDGPDYRQFRRIWIEIVALAREYNPQLYQQIMGFPTNLPNLARCKPPGGNSRRRGLRNSYFAQSRRRTLPATY
jgi:hypothetical protein